jgi:hypothetical protein
MTVTKKLASAFAAGIACLLLVQPARSEGLASEPVSRAELRDLLIRITELLDVNGNNSEAARSLRQRIDLLDPQSFERLYGFSSNWKKLRIAVDLMSKGSTAKNGDRPAAVAIDDVARQAASTAGLPADRFDAGYPSGSNYSTFRATLPGLGAMSDTPGSVPGLDDERCNSNFEAGVAIASATFAFANIIAETACEALTELLDIGCWIAQGVLQAAAEANNTVAAQCAIVDGAVDATEIEAAFENTVAIYKNLDAHHLALKTHDADIKTTIASAVNTLLITLNKHDVDIKAAIAAVKGVVDQNTQLLKVSKALDGQIIRLLLTPEGKKEVNPAVMTCTGDNCPAVLDCPGKECSFPIN